MKTLITFLLIAGAATVSAESLRSLAQVRQHLVDAGKIASQADGSLDGNYELLSLGGDAFLTVRNWDAATLGAQPAADGWPAVATSQTNLAAAEVTKFNTDNSTLDSLTKKEKAILRLLWVIVNDSRAGDGQGALTKAQFEAQVLAAFQWADSN